MCSSDLGGTLTLLAACTSDVFRAAASFSGEADEKVFSSAPPWSDIVPFDLSDPREFEMRSALTHPASFKAPTRLYYGTEEQVFRPVKDELVGLAKAAGRDVDSATLLPETLRKPTAKPGFRCLWQGRPTSRTASLAACTPFAPV